MKHLNALPLFFVLLATLILTRLPACADITPYTDPAAFQRDVLAASTITFDHLDSGTPIPDGTLIDGGTFTFSATGHAGLVTNLYCSVSGRNTLGINRSISDPVHNNFFFPGDAFTITFDKPITAFGAFFNSNEAAGNALGFITISTPVGTAGNGDSLPVETSNCQDQGRRFHRFVGLTSRVPFSRVTIAVSKPSPGNVGFVVDNIILGTLRASTAASIGLVDPVSELLVGPLLTSITAAPDRLARLGIPRIGVAADGISRLLLRVTAPGPGRVSFLLVDQDDQILTNSDDYGILTDLQGLHLNGSLQIDTINTGVAPSPHKAFVLYTAPTRFARSNADFQLTRRTIYVKARFAGGTTVDVPAVPINIIRPPVFLVHGIWSCRNTWTTLEPRLRQAGFYVRTLDYRDPSSETPPPCVASRGFAESAAVVYQQIKGRMTQFRSIENVAAIQSDLVAHSMGAPIIRTMTLGVERVGIDFLTDKAFPTFGRGPVHRLVTIDGVHLGTPLANTLLACSERAHKAFARLVGPVTNGAVRDLAVGSGVLNAINSAPPTPFGVHTIVGLAGTEDEEDNEWMFQILDGTACPGNRFRGFSETLGSGNDLLVPGLSQSGGRQQPAGVIIPQMTIVSVDPTTRRGVVHSGAFYGESVLDSDNVANTTISILRSPLPISFLFTPLPVTTTSRP